MLRKLRNVSRFSLPDWLFFFQAWYWLLVFDLGLRIRPFPDLQAYASRLVPHSPQTPELTENLILAIKNAVDHARYNHIYPMTCLRRSLAMQKMLALRGLATEFKIGVRKGSGEKFSAHAWLEYQGKPLAEPEYITEKFSTLQRNQPPGDMPLDG